MNEKTILGLIRRLSEKKYNLIYIHIILLLSLTSLLISLALFNASGFSGDYGMYTAAKEILFSAAGTFSVGISSAVCFRKIKIKMK